tara:strand:+ start:704 stop:868 length:165 start_codon:yes stop_codon:yes gene_type:complete
LVSLFINNGREATRIIRKEGSNKWNESWALYAVDIINKEKEKNNNPIINFFIKL